MPYNAALSQGGILIQVDENDPLHERLMWIPGSSKSDTGVLIPEDLIPWRQAVRITGNDLDPNAVLRSELLDSINWEDEYARKALDIHPRRGYGTARYGLFTHQYLGRDFLQVRGHAILADDMGLGKTATALATVQDLYRMNNHDTQHTAYPALIIAPASVLYSWADEAKRLFQGTALTFVVTGTAAQKRKVIDAFVAEDQHAKFLIVSYDTARSMSGFASYGKTKGRPDGPLNEIEWKTVIVDEAHKIVNRRSQQTRAVWRLSKCANYRFALTGTPVVNNHGDLWSLLHFLEPELFTSYHKFVEYFLDTWEPPWGGIQINGVKHGLESEWKKMIGSRMRRIMKSMVFKDLPEKTHQIVRVDMTPKQRKAYQSMAKEYLAEVEGGELEAIYDIEKWGQLFNLAQGEIEIDSGGTQLITKSPKIDTLMQILDSRGKGKTVVFSDRLHILKAAQEAAHEAGYLTDAITGELTSEEKDDAKETFQNGDTQVLFCSLRAANAGITLTAADTMIFMNKSWSNVQNVQAEDRIHRIGQEKPCHYIHILSNGTVEVSQPKILAAKAGTLEDVVRDKERLKHLINGGDLQNEQESAEGSEESRLSGVTRTAGGYLV